MSDWKLLFGCIFGAVFCLLTWWCVCNYRRATAYERAVRAHIGDDHEWVYDEQIMLDFYNAGYAAADCAREMVAVNCED